MSGRDLDGDGEGVSLVVLRSKLKKTTKENVRVVVSCILVVGMFFPHRKWEQLDEVDLFFVFCFQ